MLYQISSTANQALIDTIILEHLLVTILVSALVDENPLNNAQPDFHCPTSNKTKSIAVVGIYTSICAAAIIIGMQEFFCLILTQSGQVNAEQLPVLMQSLVSRVNRWKQPACSQQKENPLRGLMISLFSCQLFPAVF